MMPCLEPEVSHIEVRQRRCLPPPEPRVLDLHYRDGRGALRLWTRAWPVLPMAGLDPSSNLYLLLDRGDPVIVRATKVGEEVICALIRPSGETASTLTQERFDDLCLGVVLTQISDGA
jgi:hypothetical protein